MVAVTAGQRPQRRGATGTRPRRASPRGRARSRSGDTIDSSRPSASVAHVRVARCARRTAGLLVDEPAQSGRRTSGSRPSVACAQRRGGDERQQADHRPHPQRRRARRRRGAGRRSRSRPRRPTGPGRGWPRRCRRSARRTWSPGPRRWGRARPAPARSPAGRGSTSPSRPCRRTARGCRAIGQRRRAVDRADVVEAEEAALEHVVALGVLAVDPPGEVEQQLVEDRARGTRSRRPPSISNTRSAAQACTGGLTSPKAHSYAGSWPLGCMYHSRHSRSSCSLANSGSTWAMATQWKARSHAAYHGYSHVSGIEMTSSLLRWRHSRLRPSWRAAGGGGPAGSPSSQRSTS